MRVASFVNHLEFEFEGNIAQNAIYLGDVDNDGLNELVVGNENGDLAVYKGDSCRPVRVASDLGLISAVSVGDLFNNGRNVLVVVTGCGYCYVYDFEDDKLSDITDRRLQPVHAQRIPANVKVILIGDVNGDGFSEMVVALTDRVVRTYHWVNAGDIVGGKPCGKLIVLNKWELADQIGGITFNLCADNSSALLVSQPGGTYFTIKVSPPDELLDPFDEINAELLTKMSLDYDPLASARLRNAMIHTEICGNIKYGSELEQSEEGSAYALATKDGTLMLVRNGKIQWNLQVDHQLFSIFALDVTKNGNQEVIACAWDGNTYIVGQNTDCVRFTFPEFVNTFSAGYYGLNEKQTPCLVYATFGNGIHLYHSITLGNIVPRTLGDVLKSNLAYQDELKHLQIDIHDTDKIKELNQFLLYARFNI